MLFPLVTNVYWSAYEARPHGLVAGFCGLALVCWQQAAAEGARQRLFSLAGLLAALVIAVSNHAYGLLTFMPVVIGELRRSAIRRRIDVPIWSVLALAFLGSCVSLIPLMRLMTLPDMAPPTGRLWSPSAVQVLVRLLDSYRWHVEPAALVIAAALLVFCGDKAASVSNESPPADRLASSSHETAALWGLTAMPIFAMALSLTAGAPFYDRYGLAFAGGFAGLLGLVVSRSPVRAMLVSIVLLAQVVANNVVFVTKKVLVEPSTRLVLYPSLQSLADEYEVIEKSLLDDHMPIALLDDLDFATVVYYAPPALAFRMTYLMQGALDVNGRAYSRLKSCCGAAGNIASLAEFKAAHPRFLIHGRVRAAPRVQELLNSGLEVRMISLSSDRFLALVTRRPE